MAKKYSRFLIGLFVTLGLVLGLILVIWLGAARYFEKGQLYAAYFDESVQGLQIDSSVKYRGVDVGRVTAIRVAPDHRLVEVLMKIRMDVSPRDRIVAKLKTAGITGIVFIELDRLEGGEQVTGRHLSFEPPYPVILTGPSDIKQIMQGMADIYGKIKMIDFEGLTMEAKRTVQSINAFFQNKHLLQTLDHMERTFRAMESTMAKIDRLADQGKVSHALDEANRTLVETRELISMIKEEIAAFNLGRKGGDVDRLMENLDRRSQRISVHLERLMKSMEQTAEQLRFLFERLERNPSDLLFGQPVGTEREEKGAHP